jgi:hypothetical protein
MIQGLAGHGDGIAGFVSDAAGQGAVGFCALPLLCKSKEPLNKSGRSRLASEMCRFKARIAGNSALLPRFATQKLCISGPSGSGCEFMTCSEVP